MSFWKKGGDSGSNPPGSAAGTPAAGTSTPSAPVPGRTSTQATVTPTPTPAASTAASKTPAPAQTPAPAAASGVPAGASSRPPEDILIERFGKTRSALGEGTVIQGKLSFDTPVRIDGKLSGEIFSSKVLIIGPTGLIDAKIEVASLIVLGSVKGEINATERVEVWSGATLEGRLRSPTLVVQDGGFLGGTCEMLSFHKGADIRTKKSPSDELNGTPKASQPAAGA